MSTADLRQIILFTDVENSFSLTFTDWFYWQVYSVISVHFFFWHLNLHLLPVKSFKFSLKV